MSVSGYVRDHSFIIILLIICFNQNTTNRIHAKLKVVSDVKGLPAKRLGRRKLTFYVQCVT